MEEKELLKAINEEAEKINIKIPEKKDKLKTIMLICIFLLSLFSIILLYILITLNNKITLLENEKNAYNKNIIEYNKNINNKDNEIDTLKKELVEIDQIKNNLDKILIKSTWFQEDIVILLNIFDDYLYQEDKLINEILSDKEKFKIKLNLLKLKKDISLKLNEIKEKYNIIIKTNFIPEKKEIN